jgi:hypothetical protein
MKFSLLFVITRVLRIAPYICGLYFCLYDCERFMCKTVEVCVYVCICVARDVLVLFVCVCVIVSYVTHSLHWHSLLGTSRRDLCTFVF